MKRCKSWHGKSEYHFCAGRLSKKSIVILSILLALPSMASAMSDKDKAAYELTASGILNNQSYISLATVNIGSGNTLNIWIVPKYMGQTDLSQSTYLAVATFVQGRHIYQDLSRMELTFGSDKNNALCIMSCLGSWADTIRYQDDMPNANDIKALAEKVWNLRQNLV